MSNHGTAIGWLANVGVSPSGLVELSAEAEEAGYSGAWMVEYEYDSTAIAQAIIQGTERIHSGNCILRVFTRHPVSLAESAAVIDALAPGRFAIGLGTGPMKRAAPDVPLQRWGLEWDKPVARMREYVQVVKLVLGGGVVDYDGQFFQLHNVQPNIVPSAPIPVWVAAGGPSMMRVAGAEADGVFTHMANRGMTERLRETVALMTREAGREPEDVPLGNLLMVCVDDDAEVARAAMRHWLVDFYLSLPGYQELLAREGYEDVANAVRDALGRGDVAGAEAAVPDVILDDFMLAGTPEECRAKLREFVAWGTDLPILYPFPSREDWLDGYRRTIAAFAPDPAYSRSRRTA